MYTPTGRSDIVAPVKAVPKVTSEDPVTDAFSAFFGSKAKPAAKKATPPPPAPVPAPKPVSQKSATFSLFGNAAPKKDAAPAPAPAKVAPAGPTPAQIAAERKAAAEAKRQEALAAAQARKVEQQRVAAERKAAAEAKRQEAIAKREEQARIAQEKRAAAAAAAQAKREQALAAAKARKAAASAPAPLLSPRQSRSRLPSLCLAMLLSLLLLPLRYRHPPRLRKSPLHSRSSALQSLLPRHPLRLLLP